MWVIVDQDKLSELNDAVNDMWGFVAHLELLCRWRKEGAMYNDLVQLREVAERITESLNTAILWEQFA